MTPGRPNGSTAILITSQRVAPRASAASSCILGTWRNTSREIAAMIGRIMTASTIDAVSIERPTMRSPPNSGMNPRYSLRNSEGPSMNGTRKTTPHRP